MNPYLPFAAIPLAVGAGWFAASKWTMSEPGRYRVPPVVQIEKPAVPKSPRSTHAGKSDVRVAAFLPHVPSRPENPDPALVLHSVMTASDVNLATINGYLVKEGDQVAGYLVKHIGSEGVDLEAGGTTRHLPMRRIHELPPPVEPGVDTVQRNAAMRQNPEDVTQDFWATFDSTDPRL